MFRDVVHSLGSTAPIRKVLTLGHVTNRCAPLTATHRRLRDPPYISLSFLHVFSFAHPTLYLLLSDSQIVRYLFHPPASSSPHPYQTQPMSSHISSSGSTGHEISSVPSSAPSARSAAPLSAATTEPPSVAPSQSAALFATVVHQRLKLRLITPVRLTVLPYPKTTGRHSGQTSRDPMFPARSTICQVPSYDRPPSLGVPWAVNTGRVDRGTWPGRKC
jgi:hypothetical protein